MKIVNLFYGILEHLGIWEKVPIIVFLGLSDAGRIFLLHRPRDEGLLYDHTLYLNGEEYRIGNIKFRAFAFDGLQIARRVLRDYHLQEDGVVYVFDGSDESRRELISLRNDELLANVPLREFEDLRLVAVEDLELFISGVAAMMPYGRRNQYLNLEPIRLYVCFIIFTFVVYSPCLGAFEDVGLAILGLFISGVAAMMPELRRHRLLLWNAYVAIGIIQNVIIKRRSQCSHGHLTEKHPVLMGTFMFALNANSLAALYDTYCYVKGLRCSQFCDLIGHISVFLSLAAFLSILGY